MATFDDVLNSALSQLAAMDDSYLTEWQEGKDRARRVDPWQLSQLLLALANPNVQRLLDSSDSTEACTPVTQYSTTYRG